MSEGQRSVVVTGPGAGIGRAIADRLADDGWFVVGLERDADAAAQLEASLGERGAVVVGDVTERAQLRAAAQRARGAAPLGGWVNNAGIALVQPLHEAQEADTARLLSINLEAVFWGCAEAVQAFLDQRSGGAIVNVSSIHARAAFPGWAAYATAKGGVESLTRYVAVEYGAAGVRANAIAPGAIRTPLLQRDIEAADDPAAAEGALAALHPLARIGEPAEVAAAASFLLSDGASFVSGQSLGVDGAASARCYGFPTYADGLAGAASEA